MDKKKIKALEFEERIDSSWWSHKTNYNMFLINNLLKECDIPFDREDLIDYGNIRIDDVIKQFGVDKIIKEFNSYIPSNKEKTFEYKLCVKCLNTKCEHNNDGNTSCYEFYSDCWSDKLINMDIAIAIGGESAKKELIEKWEMSKEFLDELYIITGKGIYEKELYDMGLDIEKVVRKFQRKLCGDYNMFFNDLCKLNGDEGITVFYTDGMMYVNDTHDNQAFISSDIYQAYCFAKLLLANLDYVADDKEVKELHDKLLKLIEEDNRAIDVWNYFDDIHDDFEKLTGIDLNIDVKRDIVSKMVELDEEGDNLLYVLGSSSLIARKLWNYIKGNDKFNIPKCDNELINELADEYLVCDEYDLIKFAEELHKKVKQNKLIKIDGKLVINNVEYDYIDEIEINDGKLNIYWKKGLVGGILIKHIKSINEELNNGVTVALIDYIMGGEL